MQARLLLLCIAGTLTAGQQVTAAVTNWTVQSASSQLAISGALSSGGSFLVSLYGQPGHQSPFYVSTRYSGSIATQMTPGSIEFLSASLDAQVSGNWDPLPGGGTGLAPADYGVIGDAGFLPNGMTIAIRDLVLGLSSNAITLSGTPALQTFNGTLASSIDAGTADYRGFGIIGSHFGFGTLGLVGETDSFNSSGSIAYGVAASTMSIPVDFDVYLVIAEGETSTTADDLTVQLNLYGAVVATAVPEANSLLLLGLAGSVVGFVGYRRTRRTVI